MANDKYIKVTPKGEEPRVILASLRNFYVSQGAKIETPTEAEIIAAYPDEKNVVNTLPARSADERLRAEIIKWKENAVKQAEKIKLLNEEKSNLAEKVKVLETSLAETEELVKRLNADGEKDRDDKTQRTTTRKSRYSSDDK